MRVVTSLLSILMLAPTIVEAQDASDTFHATQEGWADYHWLRLIDREGAEHGRFADRGFLQRFGEGVDKEFFLDIATQDFTLMDEYSWWTRDNGARWNGSSVDRLSLASTGRFKAAVPFASSWSAGVDFLNEESPIADRQLLRLNLQKNWGTQFFTRIEGSMGALKSDSDLELAVGWEQDRESITVGVTFLDLFSDALFNLPFQRGDTTRFYGNTPVAFRVSATKRFTPSLRAEIFYAASPQTVIESFAVGDETAGWRQEEELSYATSLVEWTPIPNLMLGVHGSWVRGETIKTPRSGENQSGGFVLTETETTLGAFAAWQGGPFYVESRLSKNWRPEARLFTNPETPDSFYEDTGWTSRSIARVNGPFGLGAFAGLALDLRDVTRDEIFGLPDANLGQDNERFMLGGSWRWNDQIELELGINYDLDTNETGPGSRSVDGGVGRVKLYW